MPLLSSLTSVSTLGECKLTFGLIVVLFFPGVVEQLQFDVKTCFWMGPEIL